MRSMHVLTVLGIGFPVNKWILYPESKQLHVWVLVADASFQGLGGVFGRDLFGADLVADLEVQGQVL